MHEDDRDRDTNISAGMLTLTGWGTATSSPLCAVTTVWLSTSSEMHKTQTTSFTYIRGPEQGVEKFNKQKNVSFFVEM